MSACIIRGVIVGVIRSYLVLGNVVGMWWILGYDVVVVVAVEVRYMIYDTVLTIGLSTTAANFCWMLISL